jgi:hypothetical protein
MAEQRGSHFPLAPYLGQVDLGEHPLRGELEEDGLRIFDRAFGSSVVDAHDAQAQLGGTVVDHLTSCGALVLQTGLAAREMGQFSQHFSVGRVIRTLFEQDPADIEAVAGQLYEYYSPVLPTDGELLEAHKKTAHVRGKLFE